MTAFADLSTVIACVSPPCIALRGDRNDLESNFIQLTKLCGIDDPNVMKHLEQYTDKYTCHQVKDEMIRIMALHILKKISADFSVRMRIYVILQAFNGLLL